MCISHACDKQTKKDMAQQRSRNYTVLHKNRARLVEKAKDCLQKLTDAAFQRDLISEETKKECCNEATSTDGRAQALVDALLERVGEEDGCFNVLVQVLGRITALAHLGNQLEDESRKHVGGYSAPKRGERSPKVLNDLSERDSGFTSKCESASASPLLDLRSRPAQTTPNDSPKVGRSDGRPLLPMNLSSTPRNDERDSSPIDSDDPDMLVCVEEVFPQPEFEGGGECEHASMSSSTLAVESTAEQSTSVQEVNRTSSGSSIVTSSAGYMTHVSSSSSVSSIEEVCQSMRLDLAQRDARIAQKDARIADLQCQIAELKQKLERTKREKEQAMSDLKSKEEQFHRVTEEKDAEIQVLQQQVQTKEVEIAEYRCRIAEKERENEEVRQQYESATQQVENEKELVMELYQTRTIYEEKVKELEQTLKEEEAQKVEAVVKLADIRVALAQKETAYAETRRLHEKEVHDLSLQVSEQAASEERLKAELAQCQLDMERLKRKCAEKKRHYAEQRHRDAENKRQEAEQRHQDAERRHSREIEELKKEIFGLRMKDIQEEDQPGV